MQRCLGTPRRFRVISTVAGCAVLALSFTGSNAAIAGEQFAVIRPQLQFDAADPWAYPRGLSTHGNARLLAGRRSGGRRFSGETFGGRLGSGTDAPATGANRRRGPRKPSPFEATGATPLLRDLPPGERNPPPTRRRALGW